MRTRSVRAMCCKGLQFALICFSPFPLFSQGTSEASSGAAALAPYGSVGTGPGSLPCQAPSHEGVAICQPPSAGKFTFDIPSPFQVIAAGTSGRAQVKLMELWADGKKVTGTNGSPFDEPVTLDLGTHQLTVVERDQTGAFVKSAPFTVSVVPPQISGICSPPGSPGVNVCSPLPNSCNTQPWVPVVAAGKGKSGTVNRMELWFGGAKIANFPGDRINTNLVMLGIGTIKIYEVDSKGASIASSLRVFGPC
jgi:hypothetical protein